MADKLRARARELLTAAADDDGAGIRDLNPILDDFNARQMSGRSPAQQQQQIQPKKDGSDDQPA